MNEFSGRSIELFLVDGKPDGMLTAQIPFQWTGHILMANRSQIKEALLRKEASRTGIYILLGSNEKGELIYIGETEEIRKRIKQHAQNKDWWNSAILITDSDDHLHKSHVKYIESRLIEIVSDIGKIQLENGNCPPRPSLTEAAQCDMEGFLLNILLVLPALRIDYFTSDKRPVVQSFVKPENVTAGMVFELVTKRHGIRATAVLENGEFIVQSGSLAKKEWTGVESTYTKLHQELIKIGVLVPEGKHCRFTDNYAFKSTSAAGAVVNGRSTAGPRDWKVKGTNTTYGEWEAERLNE